MLIVPLKALPSQKVTIVLGGQSCLIDVYQRSTGLYNDLFVNDALIIGGVIARNLVVMVRSLYLGFIGDLAYFDTQPDKIHGPSDPDFVGLGLRYQLIWFAPEDLPVGIV